MPALRCTRKLLAEAGIRSVPELERHADDWHANPVRIGSSKIVLFCSTETLYCCLTPVSSRREIRALHALFLSALSAKMRADGFSGEAIDHCQAQHAHMGIGTTDDRSVVGSMNDYIFMLRHLVESAGGLEQYDAAETAVWLNGVPQVRRDFGNAGEGFRRKLAAAAD